MVVGGNRVYNRFDRLSTMTNLNSATAPLVLILDIGSSSIRASVYDSRCARVREATACLAHRLVITPDGGVEANAESLLDLAVHAIDITLEQVAVRAEEIEAVAVSVFASSVVGVDGAGRALTPVYTYADSRSAADTAGLRAEWDRLSLYDRTGCPLHASYLPSRFRWLKRTRPDLVDTVCRWISFGEYLYEQIFERPCGLGVSVASWSGLLNRRSMTWDLATLAAVGIDQSCLGEIDVTAAPLHGVASRWAERWPVLGDVAWFPPLGDGVCSNIGTAVAPDLTVVVNLGTSAAVRVIVPGPVAAVPEGLWEYRIGPEQSLLGGALTDGGSVARWVGEFTRAGPSDDWDASASEVAPDGHGLSVLPFFTGERSPGWDDGARATVHGLRQYTRASDLLRASMEAVTYRLLLIYDLLRGSLPATHTVTLSGGGFRRSAVWCQMVTDAFGCRTTRSSSAEETSCGAALWALRELDIIPSLAVGQPSEAEALAPNPTNEPIYRSALERQQRLYKRLVGSNDLETG